MGICQMGAVAFCGNRPSCQDGMCAEGTGGMQDGFTAACDEVGEDCCQVRGNSTCGGGLTCMDGTCQ